MPEDTAQKPFLSIQDAANLLDLDYKTVYRMVLSGQLPAAKLGGVYRIRRQDLETFFEQQKTGGSAAVQGLPVAQPPLCARCERAIRVPSFVGGKCQADGCEMPLCTICWSHKESRLCKDHQEG